MPDADGPWLAQRISRRTAVAQLVAGFTGALDVFLLQWFVLPAPDHGVSDTTLFLINAVAFVVFMSAGGVIGWWWGGRWFRPVRAWVEAERAPTARERNFTLAVPLRCSIINATAWLSAAALFFVINAPFSIALACHVAEVIVLGGLTCVALGYLLTERIMRPITARALSYGPVAPRRPGVKGRLVLTWLCASGVPMLGLVLLGAGILADPIETTVPQMAWSVVAIAAIGLTAGLLGTALVAKSLAEPLSAMRAALTRVEEGDLTARVQVDDGSEVGLLQSRFNAMTAGLEERERLRDLFGRHVGEEVVQSALDGDAPRLGGEVRDVAVLFADLVGSTAMAAERPPAEVVRVLNDFFAIVVDVAKEHGGWVNKFEGDAALVVFGAPADHADAAGAALGAARELHRRMDGMPLRAGIGVSAGPAVAGNVGAEERFEYTVIGDPVNEAARLCELAKRRDDCVLASATAIEAASGGERHRWLECDEVLLRGRRDPTRIAAPVGARDRTAASPLS
jgi:adenylate cyclase